jgi:WhiB family redox-sensing transcriptional regulator
MTRSPRVASAATFVWHPEIEPAGDWILDAACRDQGTTLFFPTVGDRGTYNAAVALCGECPVRQSCLDYAVTNRIPFGVWGGLNEDRRRKLAGKIPRSPRKLPPHGAHRYRKGCRCDECRYAHRIESARYREAAR